MTQEDLTHNALPHRFNTPLAIIVHGTGNTHESGVRDYYRTSPDKACPHFFINAQGETYKIADPAKQEAWHCHMDPEEVALYQRGLNTWQNYTVQVRHNPEAISNGVDRYKAWRDQWARQGLQSPLGLVTGDRPNFHSIGIELLCLEHPTPRVFANVQYEALALLVCQLAAQFNIPVGRSTVLGHADANPLSRNDKYGLTDPGQKFDWSYLFKLISSVKR